MNNVTVIVPVYDGIEETCSCLESLLASRPLHATPFDILLINDASPNPELSAYLEQYARNEGVTLLVNEKNMGFVGTVNRGMRHAKKSDVVLLNSDTEVANNWLDRMRACALAEPGIGSVTPFSNNAEICSFPAFVKDNALPRGVTVQSLDAIFSRLEGHAPVEIPTGVGFCMYITRACLDKTGYFDEKTFGRGYGEENDFCMRSAQKGFRHVIVPNVFVFHAGGVSFGPEKLKRVQKAMETLDRLYPDYHEVVHQFVQQDPPRAIRFHAYLEYMREICRDKHKVLAITHNLGGGTERHIRELAEYMQEKAVFLVARVSGSGGGRVNLSLGCGESDPYITLTLPADYSFLLNVCRYVGIGRVHCHHIMGADPSLWALLDDLKVPLDITLHDYYFINGNPTLTDPAGEFCADPLTRDERCSQRYPVPGHASPEFWRHNQGGFLRRAARVFSPCAYTASIYKAYFPDVPIQAVYHPDWEAEPIYPPVEWPALVADEPLRVAVLGAISKEKGADILDATARLATRGDAVDFSLIGYAYRPLEPSIHTTGPYRDHELDGLIRSLNPHVIWFPCRWPETYSYTLSAALKAGLPIMAPDLGAFPERLQRRDFSWIKPWQTAPDAWLAYFQEMRVAMEASGDRAVKRAPPVSSPSAFRYQSDYVVGMPVPPDDQTDIDLMTLNRLASMHPAVVSLSDPHRPLTDREKILIWLLKARSRPWVYSFLRHLPFNFMQLCKRSLSERPIHELLGRYQEQGSQPVGLFTTVIPGLLRILFREQA